MDYTKKDVYLVSRWIIDNKIEIDGVIDTQLMKSEIKQDISFNPEHTDYFTKKIDFVDSQGRLTQKGYNRSRSSCEEYERYLHLETIQLKLNESQININTQLEKNLINQSKWYNHKMFYISIGFVFTLLGISIQQLLTKTPKYTKVDVEAPHVPEKIYLHFEGDTLTIVE